jgi:hypothetical protein
LRILIGIHPAFRIARKKKALLVMGASKKLYSNVVAEAGKVKRKLAAKAAKAGYHLCLRVEARCRVDSAKNPFLHCESGRACETIHLKNHCEDIAKQF